MKITNGFGEEKEIPKVVLERLRKRFGDKLESLLEDDDFCGDTLLEDEEIQEHLKTVLSKEEADFWASLAFCPIDGGYGVLDEYSFVDGNTQYTVLISGYQDELEYRMTKQFVYKEPVTPNEEP